MSEAPAPRRIDEDLALRAVVEATASETGLPFYRALVESLSRTLDTHGAWVTEFLPHARTMRTLAFWFGGRHHDSFEYDTRGTPCELVIHDTSLIHIPDRVMELYPGPPPEGFPRVPESSYLGMPLLDTDGTILGHLAVVDIRPMPAEKRLLTLFQLFAGRAAAEMRRLRLEGELRQREEKLSELVGSAMDAILELDGELRVTLMNAAAEKLFHSDSAHLREQPLDRLLGPDATRLLKGLARELDGRPAGERSLWIPGGFPARPADLPGFHAEATLSRFEVRGRSYYSMILRNVDERVEAERRIHALSAQAEYLREEIAADHGFDEIVGGSAALRATLRGVEQVAATQASVLLLGETGTGKELFARAIHQRSPRRDRPLIKVNCAAIPATLIESEFFGHERGAFTGATQRREGRFALADGGTIFLDEIGELPLELQGKLLRVLQEGEFEPVGASRTRKVDVRVLAATHRDLEAEVKQGRFREDLYYRLSVFPLTLPPLRERGEDVVRIATHLAGKLARGLGRPVQPLTAADVRALQTYPWPGNVRELRNVIERALITSRDGWLRLDQMLPLEGAEPAAAPATAASTGDSPAAAAAPELLDDRRLREVERRHMIAALDRCDWRVGGEGGAAELFGIRPSTFKSRMKSLGIERPARGISPRVSPAARATRSRSRARRSP